METLEESYRYGTSALPDDRIVAVRTHLFGSHISKSLSPLILSIVFRACGLPWVGQLSRTTDPKEFVEMMRDSATIGGSITMPNKVTFMPKVDILDDKVRGIGAMNTCYIRLGTDGKRRIVGTNTDCVGIRESLLRIPSIDKNQGGRPAAVFGAGGAARSAIYALWTWFGPSEIYIVNRLKEEVEVLVAGMEASLPGVKLRHVQTLEDARMLQPPVIVVGTVPDMEPRTSTEHLTRQIGDIIVSSIDTSSAVLDMCYMPSPFTNLVKLGQKRGCHVILGNEVLVRVVTAQASLWMERLIDQDTISRTSRVLQQLVESEIKPASKL